MTGFQTAKETLYPLQAAACCKHFVANELDGWNGTDRNHIDSYVPQQDLVDSYLPSFQTCVEQGKVAGIMCSSVFPATLRLARGRLRSLSLRLSNPAPPPLPPKRYDVQVQCRQRRALVRELMASW